MTRESKPSGSESPSKSASPCPGRWLPTEKAIKHRFQPYGQARLWTALFSKIRNTHHSEWRRTSKSPSGCNLSVIMWDPPGTRKRFLFLKGGRRKTFLLFWKDVIGKPASGSTTGRQGCGTPWEHLTFTTSPDCQIPENTHSPSGSTTASGKSIRALILTVSATIPRPTGTGSRAKSCWKRVLPFLSGTCNSTPTFRGNGSKPGLPLSIQGILQAKSA